MNGNKTNKLSLLKGKKPREIKHPIVLDHQAVEAYADARNALQKAKDELRLARRRSEPEITLDELQAAVDAAQKEVDELEPAADEGNGITTVLVRAMPPVAYAALKAEFPPTDDDHARLRELTGDDKAKAAFNRNEFQPRLVAHCLADPAASLEDARSYMESWNEPDWNLLVGACLRANQETIDVASLVFSSGRTRG